MNKGTKILLAFATIGALGCQPSSPTGKSPPAPQDQTAVGRSAPGWHGTTSPIAGPTAREWHAPPQPVEQTLLAHYSVDVTRLTGQLATPHQPSREVYGCIIGLRGDAPVLRSLQLAQLYNAMVTASMPGYAEKPLHPLPTAETIAELDRRFELRRQECLDFLPTAAPELEIDHDDRDEASRWARQQSFKALEQLGDGMLDRAHELIWSRGNSQAPDETFCRVMREGMSRWDRTYGRIPDSVEEDNYEIQIDKFKNGIMHLCR
jgi:hypothetical protein